MLNSFPCCARNSLLRNAPPVPPYPLTPSPPPPPPPRRGLLVTPKDHWPPFDGGLTMELVASGGGRGGEEEEGN